MRLCLFGSFLAIVNTVFSTSTSQNEIPVCKPTSLDLKLWTMNYEVKGSLFSVTLTNNVSKRKWSHSCEKVPVITGIYATASELFELFQETRPVYPEVEPKSGGELTVLLNYDLGKKGVIKVPFVLAEIEVSELTKLHLIIEDLRKEIDKYKDVQSFYLYETWKTGEHHSKTVVGWNTVLLNECSVPNNSNEFFFLENHSIQFKTCGTFKVRATLPLYIPGNFQGRICDSNKNTLLLGSGGRVGNDSIGISHIVGEVIVKQGLIITFEVYTSNTNYRMHNANSSEKNVNSVVELVLLHK